MYKRRTILNLCILPRDQPPIFMASYTSFEELDCYQKCRALRKWIHKFLGDNKIRDRDIVQNIMRAGRSTTRNIAEGFGRHHHKENMQYCRISRGSIHEILDDFNIIYNEGLAKEMDLKEGRTIAHQALKSLNGYINYLKGL